MKDNTEQKTAAFYALVRGRVQGVGFRYSAIREAQRLRLSGWVKNTYNGDVEVWAEGPKEKLELFIAWLRRGPQLARVDSINIEDKNPVGYNDFDVKY
jgi:acylphosphatase